MIQYIRHYLYLNSEVSKDTRIQPSCDIFQKYFPSPAQLYVGLGEAGSIRGCQLWLSREHVKVKHHSVRQSLSPSVRSHNARNFSLIPVNLTVRGPSGVSLKYVLCFANFFGKRFFPRFPPPHFVEIIHGEKDQSILPCLGGAAVQISLKIEGCCVADVIYSRLMQHWKEPLNQKKFATQST